MASQRESGHRKRASQDSRGFVYIPGEEYIPADSNNKPQNQRTAKASPPKQSSGTFIQYERIDLDPLNPPEPDARPFYPSGIPVTESDVTRTPLFGHSDRDSLLSPSGKPNNSLNSNKSTPKPNMQGKPGKGSTGGSSPKRGGTTNSGYLTPPQRVGGGGDPNVGAKLASHSPEREGGLPLQGYSFTHHDCQIRSPSSVAGSTAPRWDSPQPTATATTKLPAGAVKLPVPVPRSKPRDTSRPSSTASSSAAAPGPALTTPTTTTSSSSTTSSTPEWLDNLVTPDPQPGHVIIRQPGLDAPTEASGNSAEPGASSNPNAQTSPSTHSNKNLEDGNKSKKSKEAENGGGVSKSKHPLNGIPQTNFMIGLLVTCCFNPPLGLIAMAISLRAAAAYRDGDNKRGACRARASIIISLFSIMITMVVVSTLLVYTAVDKHGYGKKKDSSSTKSVLPFGF